MISIVIYCYYTNIPVDLEEIQLLQWTSEISD